MSGTAEALARYVGMDWHVVPVKAGGKRPLISGWPTNASADPKRVEKWWEKWPDANIGVVAALSGLAIVDIDGDDGEEELQRALGDRKLPPTPEALTARGRHLYFRDPGGLTKSAHNGLDLQVGAAYVIAPPSVHETGKTYQWVPGREPGATQLAELPDVLVEYFRTRNAPPPPTADGPIPEGERNATLMRIGGRLRAQGRHEEEIADELRKVNAERCKPPLARSFLCSSLVFQKCGERVAAARTAVEAAWACDDEGAVAESIHCRVLAVRLLRECSNDWDSVLPDPHTGRAVIADLLRRAELFDDAIAVIDDVVEGAPRVVAKILAFSRLRALARDPGRYTVDDAMSTKGDDETARAGFR